jgi:ATPase subunit of ABC transporter with duplicated ATPase domains
MITATKLSMRYGGKILFKDASLQLNPGNHYGLVGSNGSGKSTLIKILTGDIAPESGDIAIPNLTHIGSLKQDHFLYEETLILNVVMMGKPRLWQAWQEKHKLLEKTEFDEEACHALDLLEKEIEKEGGYTASSQAAKLLEGLGLPENTHLQEMNTLSGGYKLRVLLAQVLFSHPDVLLLDEPTNHLDLFSIRWLEGYLKNFPGTLVISSHDRDFLNAVCDHILDVDRETLKVYKGNYDQFLAIKSFLLEQSETLLAKQDKKKEHLQEFIDRFGAKATKAKQAQSKMRLVEKIATEMESQDLKPSSRAYPVLAFEICRPPGAIALKASHLCKSFGTKQVLNNVSFEVERGERIAILGANGLGKSTLLEILTQSLTPCQGTFEWGFAVQHAYFPQDHAKHVRGEHTLLSWLSQFDRQMPEQRLRDLLGKVLFSGDDVHKPIHVLSGGETARLLLAKMMLLKHNVLIFDEPTNHLDMEASEVLIEALNAYPGTLIFVSHNRHFVSLLAKRIIELTPQGFQDYRCNFEEYLQKRDHDLLAKTNRQKEISKEKPAAIEAYEEMKLQKRTKNQLEKKAKIAEEKCHQLEQQIQSIDAKFALHGFYEITSKEEVDKLVKDKRILENQLEIAFDEWESAEKAKS